MKRLLTALLGCVFALQLGAQPAHTLPRDRPGELLNASLAFAEKAWDESAALLKPETGEGAGRHRVRESASFAAGLLLRGAPGDDERAIRILHEVLRRQIIAPGQRWDGTFQRAPEEPLPREGAVLWKDFDPNWRQFIGTAFALILEEFSARLPDQLRARMADSIRRAVEGEIKEGRDEPYHTNISLMHGFLLGWAGARLGRSEWIQQSDAWIDRVRAEFRQHGTFDEYNSPTYYGVDLYGLALCRRYGATENVRSAAVELEAGLWRDIAAFYHAGLRNLCGPFDRAYGLDQRSYVSLTGIWMGLALDAPATPLPDPRGPMGHAHDFFSTPLYVVLGVNIPAEAIPALTHFQGARQLHRTITSDRSVSAWIGEELMYGGEATRLTREAGSGTRFGQFVPATAHWRIGSDDVGAFALRASPAVDATADEAGLKIATARGDSTFRIAAAGAEANQIAREQWKLPGLDVAVSTDAREVSVIAENGFVDVIYRDATRFELRLTHHP